MSGTTRSTEHLSPEEKRELLARLLQQKGGERKTFPLSFAQARLWILDRFQPGSPTYNLPMAFRLPGWLDLNALERSFNEIVRRHEVLRTTFEVVDGKPMQVIAPSLALKMSVADLRSMPSNMREAEAGRRALEESRYSFDLAKGPLIRVSLLKLADADHLLVVVMHHIISDGWSLGVFYQELSALYAAYSTGQPSPLPELPIQYADFAQWQAEWLSGEVLEQHLAYWRSQLAGVKPVLDLPTDRPRPAIQSQRGAMQPFSLDPRLCDGLTALCRREGVTLFMVLLAAFKTLLYRYTGEMDIVIGSPIANRTRPELEGLIGFFVNTLVLRTDLSGDPTFRQLLGRVREMTLEAYAHQDVPFEKLVEELAPERDLSHNPLFQVMFALQNINTPDHTRQSPARSVPDVPPLANGTAKFDLTISVAEVGRGAQGFVEYNTDLFDAATVIRLIERFQILLEGIVNNPDRRISRLPIVGEMERRNLAAGWSGPDLDFPREQTVCGIIAAHAERTPDAPAVISDRVEIGYGELNRRANRMAHRLRALGVKLGTPVGICMERSAEMVIAALGILKAGGVYVPLDPAEPAARMASILNDAGATLVVTDERLGGNLPDGTAQLFYADQDSEQLARESADEPGGEINAESLACILYRSSPAGEAEGVMVTHRALCRTAFENGLRLTASDRVAQASNLFEDAACFEIFGSLAAGAGVVNISGHRPVPPRKLASLLRDRQITVMLAPASVVERLAREFPWALRTLRLLLCDDRPSALTRLREVLEEKVVELVYSFYGSTEAGGCCTIQPLARLTAQVSVVPLGHPVAGAKLYLLDANLEPVPQGVLGEIYIGGELLARGYHARPARTASAYFPDPFSRIPGARLYRTGDLARRTSDGSIEHRGRRDGRVIIRGMRVEPKEIETVLFGHQGVREAAVITHDMLGQRDLSIAAFIVADDGQLQLAEEFRRFLQERLPDAMIPATFTLLDALPRTAAGEIDRRALVALADPSNTSRNLPPPYVAPRNEIEERLASIWSETFGTERVGIHDSFFRLGGHSLLATQVVARASDLFQIDLPLSRLFETPTIAELSRVIEQLIQTGTKAKSPPIMRMAREAISVPSDPEPQR